MRVRLHDGLMHLEIARSQDVRFHRVACRGWRSTQNDARAVWPNSELLTCLPCMAWWLRNSRRT